MLLIQALVEVFLGSRLIWLVTKRWPNSIGKAIFVNAVTALAAVIIAAFGFAHGGPPRFNMALSVYGRAQLIVLLFDVIRLIQIKPATEPR